ncbi:sushi, von Willebrand factor type A, EGF and pentraxin domain-containing protein 1 isoform X2 [Protopterus annectens]|uniref:sushi, von Willebrand factor type A, EGF and pentraxin domain-containing protein 1 isoform X2 n=1 Tax=Protopterus annectens TaxID=7888 RepID=UPI001CFBD843|nr:sushi, von Willebrand factor type A, EGF and pentraxin domain-containing protein 1 isoform X2 [Protopterus annectens]
MQPLIYFYLGLPLVCCWPNLQHFTFYKGFNFSLPRILQLPSTRQQQLEASTENKIEKLGQLFKQNVRKLREKSNSLDLVFLVDESSSVGNTNFLSELRFVKKLLSDFPVVPSATRVAIVTFSSKNHVVPRVDYISASQANHHKCSLLNQEIPSITYRGGGTYTKGAFQQAVEILQHSRGNATKVIFLITDGYSNGGDPRPVAASLREVGVEIFTFGIWQGNIRELHDMASYPKEEHCYFVHNFSEFEALARRALHEDLPAGNYIHEDISRCSYLCEAGQSCCDIMASCKCGTHTGQYECICEKGYYGKGLQHECTACPPGTYKPEATPGGLSTCIQCPDENHTSPPGSTSMEDCVCKEGFHDVDQTCEAVHCPELQAPENGYFVQNICNNHFNAACGIRCRTGFDIVGSSIRLCQSTGQWSGVQPTCRVRKCPLLLTPLHGHVNCSTSDTSYRTECHVTCDRGYRLKGTSKLTCQANSQWDNDAPQCIEINCPALQKQKAVVLSPLSCALVVQKPGTVCHLSCLSGYSLNEGSDFVQCLKSGTWSMNVQHIICRDTEPPEIICPNNIEVETLEHQNFAQVFWSHPKVKDNSGEEVSIQSIPPFSPPYQFPIGEMMIAYTATDKAKNTASCSFNINVIDREPPMIDRCRSPSPVLTVEKEYNVTWDEPQFSDNSGALLSISHTHSPGDIFPQGETLVQYVATDPSGNNRTCDIHIIIKDSACNIPFTPVNGEFVCQNEEEFVNCTLYCMDGYGTLTESAQSYYCAHDGVWKPPFSAEWPDCSLNRFANHGFKLFELQYRATRCDDIPLLNKFSKEFEMTLGKLVPSFCDDDSDIECSLGHVIRGQCLEYNYDYENGFAIGPGGWGTSWSIQNGLDYVSEDSEATWQTDSHVGMKPRRVKRYKKLDNSLTDQKIQLIFNITASIPYPRRRNDTAEALNQQRILRTLEKITNRLKRALSRDPIQVFQIESEMVFADTKSLETENAILFCRPGSVLKGHMCVSCPLGTYYSLEHKTCESCWTGSYQDEEGQLECKHCPAGSYTEYMHSRSASECKAQCKPGTYSQNGLEICESCPFGTYQPEHGSRDCIPCLDGSSTVKRGTVDVSECGMPCPAGEFSRSGLLPCYPCPRDYYQPDIGKSFCLACPFYGTTTITGASNIRHCSSFSSSYAAPEESIKIPSSENISKRHAVSSQVYHPCFENPCNNGTCQKQGTGIGYTCTCYSGFAGSKCEIDIDECSSGPCQNGAACIDDIGTFQCHCLPGYLGTLCEEDINECESSPCLNEGICEDKINAYHCRCKKGFTGSHCETEINECESSPCLNGGVCLNLIDAYQCTCIPGFAGDRCEENINECLNNQCRNGASCIDEVNTFSCQCAPGFAGKLCEADIDECGSNPCLNNAVCVDALNSFICKCPPSFGGSRCETELSAGFNLDFEVSGIYGYVIMDNVLPPLDAVSCAFWMKSSDTSNYGTPISYAVDGNDNVFSLTDYNGWVLYVNGKDRVTDCPSVNDGKWHHIAITWTSSSGEWKVYIDGKVSDGGRGLSVGSRIPGGGALVLGQEQDMRGEGFNPAESFVGSLSQLNMWDYVLTPEQVKLLSTSCPEDIKKGNLLAWPDFLKGVIGKVKIESNSIFCADCPVLQGAVPHLQSTNTNVKPGSQVKLFCDPGYQLVGDHSQQCLNLGQWSHPLPYCERISCEEPTPLENGFYSSEDFYAGSTVVYQCNNGYYLLGDSKMSCLDDGSWDSISPSCLDVDECALGSDCDKHASCLNTNGSYICTCIPPYTGDGKNCTEPVKCKDPGRMEYGQIHGSIYTVGGEMTFTCEEGYELSGAFHVTCLESGEWDHALPHCQAVSCGIPVVPPNAGAEGADFTYGSKVIYRCNKGYTPKEEKEIFCMLNGSWSHSPPHCELITCSVPDDIKNGKLILNGTTYLSTVSYECDYGFRLQGPSVLQCGDEGKWNDTYPVCVQVSCGNPPTIKDGNITGNNFMVGSRISYVCKEGFILIGPEMRDCLVSGEWSGSTSQCVPRSCDEPPPVDHALAEAHHRLFGDIAFYFCKDGYSIGNNSEMHCNAEGLWVPPPGKTVPHCIADFCERPPDIPYTILETTEKEKYATGSVVSFKCLEGFILNTSAVIECLPGGQWESSLFRIQCIPVRCGEPPKIKDGYVSGTNYSFGALVAYTCNKGFYIKGEKKRTCEATGEWSGVLPTCHAVPCGEPPGIENGWVKAKTGTDYRSEATYQCKSDFKLTGSSTRICQANRQWYSESPPSCILQACEKPPHIKHGYSKGNIFSIGSEVSFFCDEGYKLVGDAKWTCQKNGSWNAKIVPECVAAKCPDIPLLENNLVVKSATKDTGTVQFMCMEGHALHGSSVLKCLSSQQWNDSFPICTPVTCSKPPDVPYGEPVVSSLSFGSTVKYTCMDGFLFKGTPTLTCQDDGTWSFPLPECVPVECPQPEEIKNGIAHVQGLTYLSTALYTCKSGFNLIGNTTILCGEDGFWIGDKPICMPIQCPKPKEMPNSRTVYTDLNYSDTVTYLCDRGFRRQGQSTLTCLETGEWDAEAPSCKEILCEPPHPIQNGFLEGADHSFGAMIIYSCFPGFQLSGHAMQTCEESGWSSSMPECLPIDCGLPPHIDFGEYVKLGNLQGMFHDETYQSPPSYLSPLTGHEDDNGDAEQSKKATATGSALDSSGFPYGTEIMYTCYSNYELVGTSVLFCLEDGTWNGSAPVCSSVFCEPLTAPENGFVQSTDSLHGSSVWYGCNSGYELSGAAVRHCLPNRTWTDEPPACKPVTCPVPNNISNGSINMKDNTLMSVIYYSCDHGYKLSGPSKRTCLESKEWDTTEPACVPVSCGNPVIPENGHIIGELYLFAESIEYKCKDGYQLEGELISTCLANGSWSTLAPLCQRVVCRSPPSVPNGEVTGESYRYGEAIQYHCNEGYILHGAPKLYCKADGTWDMEAPTCMPVSCGPPEDISHGHLDGLSFSYGDHVQYSCFPGYELKGNTARQCQSNGMWSGSSPVCEPCKCLPPLIDNGLIIGQDFSCGEKVTFKCREGFKLLGSSEITCEAGSKWSSSFPFCEQISCEPFPVVPNAYVNSSSTEDIVIYSCMPGYVMHGDAKLTCTDQGEWSKPYPVCELASCGLPPLIQNSVALGNFYTYGSTILYRCLDNYIMNSDTDTITCQEDGRWSNINMSCDLRICPLPTNISKVIFSGTDFTISSSIILSCREGYRLLGESISICQPDGTWTSTFSDDVCTPVSCERPRAPINGKVHGTGYAFNDSTVYSCNSGYELQGIGIRRCEANGLWSGEEPECMEFMCETPRWLNNGRADYENLTIGSRVHYSCEKGYELDGEFHAECTKNGTWSFPAPVCKPKVCPVPAGLPDNAVVSETIFYVGQEVTISCHKNFRLQGQATITCNSDQTWTSVNATCNRISCGMPPHVKNAMTRGSSFDFGDIVTYSCYAGYMMEGSFRITCLKNGTWTTTPKCKAQCRFPCKNGGTCERPNSCSCPDGWMGRFCEEPICILPCLNGGKCVAPYSCECSRGWTGSRCHIAVCQSPCLNGGKCVRPNRCQCTSGWVGYDCSRKRKTAFYPF